MSWFRAIGEGMRHSSAISPERDGIHIDPETGEWTLHHWVRGACLYGIMPANGMIYAPPHPCACYIGAKMFGFTTLAPKSTSHVTYQPTAEEERLQSVKQAPDGPAAGVEEWPVYRADNTRSGATAQGVSTGGLKWSVDLGGAATPPVVAGGRVVVSLKDQNAVVALDAASGKSQWSFLAGAQVDSPPTLSKGRVYFGSADGFIYCSAAPGSSTTVGGTAPTGFTASTRPPDDRATPGPGRVACRRAGSGVRGVRQASVFREWWGEEEVGFRARRWSKASWRAGARVRSPVITVSRAR